MRLARIAGAVVVLSALVMTTPTAAQTTAPTADPRFFAQTGFRIDSDAFWNFFQQRGSVRTFGYPVSRTFTLDGFQVQIFQREIMQLQPDGGVQTLNLLDAGLMPYTKINGSTFPAPDSAIAAATPLVSDPNYNTTIQTFVRNNAPDTFGGQPVKFGTTFFSTVTAQDAPSADPALLPGFDLQIWGAPTSQPAFDPTNHQFIYQRFQRGIMMYDQTCGCTQGLLLADYFKSILTGWNLPPDLQQAAQTSRYYQQYSAIQAQWINSPASLPASDLTNAFVSERAGGTALKAASPMA